MVLQKRTNAGNSNGSRVAADEAATPGKATQTEVAAAGVSGSGQALPFADRIAESFGPAHAPTVHGIGAHTGGAATAASEDIGARAYATGNQVAFAGTPDLHTAAHEAAHVVQQRQGVHLKGGVGAAGDVYERHADAVADRVVAGESAADLLGARGTADATPAVQRKDAAAGGGAAAGKAAKPVKVDDYDADSVLRVMDDILQGNGGRLIADAPSKWQPQMQSLWQVTSGKVDGRRRSQLFDQLSVDLAPIIAHAPKSDYGADIPQQMDHLHSTVLAAEARSRVDSTILLDDNGKKEAVEIPDEGNPREEGRVLGIVLPKLVDTMKTNIERAKTAGELVGVGKETLEKMESMIQVLTLAGGWLKLNDEEFKNELTHVKSVMGGIASYSELVKTVIEMGSSAVALTCTLSGALMRAVGDEAMAEACVHTGAAVSATLGKVVGAIEVVHGLAVMFDSSKSTDDRIGGAVEAAAGVAGMVGGASAAAPIMGPYLMLKGAQYLYSEATIGWETGFLRELFSYMQEQAGSITLESESITAAMMLQPSEKDPAKRAALANEEKLRVGKLAGTLDSFLGRCEKEGPDHGVGNEFIYHYPGNFTVIAEAFTGAVNHRGAKSEADVAALAKMTMNTIAWCFRHGAAIVMASSTGKHVEDVDGIQEKMDEQKKEKKG